MISIYIFYERLKGGCRLCRKEAGVIIAIARSSWPYRIS